MSTIIENTPIPKASNATDFAEIKTDAITANRSLIAKKKFKTGEVISPFFWDKVFDKPTYLTVQLADNQHVELLPMLLECTNHSCAPNAFFDTTNKQLVCIKPIENGEDITFFYPSAEWEMDQSFVCNCGSTDCTNVVKGAKFLPENLLNKYQFTDFIQQKLNEFYSK
jgi:hypothetical protein